MKRFINVIYKVWRRLFDGIGYMAQKTYTVAVIPGDGIGPEITPEAIKVLNAVGEIRGYTFDYRPADMGGVAYYKATRGMSSGEIMSIDGWTDEEKTRLTLPQETLDIMDRARDEGGAVLFGSVGGTDLPKRVAELALLAMRKRYGVVNNRPLIIDPILAHNSILFREPVEVPGFEVISPEESLYNGEYGRSADDSYHWTRKRVTREKLEKTVEDAFGKAMDADKQILCASKYNVLVSEKMLSGVFEQFAKEYKGEVRLNSYSGDGQLIIDNACMQIASNPEGYGDTIVVVDAMFGDLLQSIVNVVSGDEPVDQEALEDIKENGIYRPFIRELCGGLYFGDRNTTPDYAYDTLYYDKKTIKNLAAVARKVGSQLGLETVDSLEISGVPTFAYWAKIMDEDAEEYGYSVRHLDVKDGVIALLRDPSSLGVVAASNMIGDVYTDLGAAVAGKSLGLMPSSAVNADGFGIYEQIAGTAPNIAGKNVANPIAEIRSAAMMLEDFGDKKGADMIYDAITRALKVARTEDIWEKGYGRVSTQDMGDLIVRYIREAA